jgi:fatty acid desaturase
MAWAIIAPLFGFINFLLLFYNFTALKEYLPFEIFIPIFIIGSGILFLFIGKMFRKKQMGIDNDLAYERAPQGAKTARIMLEYQRDLMKHLNMPVPDELEERITFMRKIEEGTVK